MKVKKETIRDLDAKRKGVKGGGAGINNLNAVIQFKGEVAGPPSPQPNPLFETNMTYCNQVTCVRS